MTITDWTQRYCPSAQIEYLGHRTLKRRDVLGIAYHYYQPRRTDIAIAIWLADHPFITRVAQWHEFCHAWNWDEGKEGHGLSWLVKMAHKPLYLLLQVPITLYCVFIKR